MPNICRMRILQNADNMNLTKHTRQAVLLLLACLPMTYIQGQQATTDADLPSLIAQLYTHPWAGPQNSCSPMCWSFHFTEPMLRILAIGPPAQGALLEKLRDAAVKDQVIILLGGVGDEHAVKPIIDAMVAYEEVARTPNAERINLAAMLALTNITVADVNWHHGGGIEFRRCPDNPKECWLEWWKQHEATFTVKGIKQSRRYSNYPNYGIYRQQ